MDKRRNKMRANEEKKGPRNKKHVRVTKTIPICLTVACKDNRIKDLLLKYNESSVLRTISKHYPSCLEQLHKILPLSNCTLLA